MSKITNLIFKNKPHYITQSFSNKHNGTDYGTFRRKIPQYAIENGVVTFVGKDSNGSKYVKINYPRINKTFLHGHLDHIYVTTNEKVDNNTCLGLTGKTGNATGIHLHLSIIDNNNRSYLNPEIYAKEYIAAATNKIITYTVKKGDTLTKIAKKYNTTWQELYAKNKDTIGNNPNLIYPNQILRI